MSSGQCVPLIFVGKKRVRRTVSDRYGLLDRTAGPPTRPSAKAKAMKDYSLIVIIWIERLTAAGRLMFLQFCITITLCGGRWLLDDEKWF